MPCIWPTDPLAFYEVSYVLFILIAWDFVFSITKINIGLLKKVDIDDPENN